MLVRKEGRRKERDSMIVGSIYVQLPWPEHALAQAASVTAMPATAARARSAMEEMCIGRFGGVGSKRGGSNGLVRTSSRVVAPPHDAKIENMKNDAASFSNRTFRPT